MCVLFPNIKRTESLEMTQICPGGVTVQFIREDDSEPPPLGPGVGVTWQLGGKLASCREQHHQHQELF